MDAELTEKDVAEVKECGARTEQVVWERIGVRAGKGGVGVAETGGERDIGEA